MIFLRLLVKFLLLFVFYWDFKHPAIFANDASPFHCDEWAKDVGLFSRAGVHLLVTFSSWHRMPLFVIIVLKMMSDHFDVKS